MHSVEKREQNLRKEDTPTPLHNLHKCSQREQNDKKGVVYGSRNYFLFPTYKSFQVTSHVQHSWSKERQVDYIKEFREFNPKIPDTFTMPVNSGRKLGF